MKAVIMAGGFGTRIQPLSSSKTKPMLPVVNLPMIEHVINAVKKGGITELVILLYFKPEMIRNYFGDGSEFGVNIKYVLPEEDFGTAGAVKQAGEYLDDVFLVVSGDLITDFHIDEIVHFHNNKNSAATICLTSVEDPLQFGVVITDKTGKILRFLEKPGWGEVFSDTINTGIYVLEPEILDYIPQNKVFDFSKDLFPLLMSKDITLYGYKASGYWRDVGNPSSYRETVMDILRGKADISIPGKLLEYQNSLFYSSGSYSCEDVLLEGVVVFGNNVYIGGKSEIINSCIGSNVSIGNNVAISESIIWDNIDIGDNCILDNCVICDNVILGKNVYMKNGGIVAENTEVGDFVVFEKDILVWPDKQIEEDSILSSNLIWGDKWKKSIFEGGKVSALTNVELSPELAAKLGAAAGSILPNNCYVVVSRDYHTASRMLKLSFLGGLLSAGVNAYDLRMSSLPLAKLQMSLKGAEMGIHFRQSGTHDKFAEILFMQKTGIPIDAPIEENIERVYFRESFRRAHHEDIGEIVDVTDSHDVYIKNLAEKIHTEQLKLKKLKLVVDLFNGTTTGIFPRLLNMLGMDTIILNAYRDQKKLAKSYRNINNSIEEIEKIVVTLNADLGLIIFQNGEKFRLVTSSDGALNTVSTVFLILKMVDMTTEKKMKAYLPVMLPNVLDRELKNIRVERGKSVGVKPEVIQEYDLYVDAEFNIAFTSYSFCPDAMYNVVKILEMLSSLDMSVEDVLAMIPDFYFSHNVISCPFNKKGTVMRKMSEYSENLETFFMEGIKIRYNDQDVSVILIPDQYSANLHLYVESGNKDTDSDFALNLKEKIYKWIQE
ncbi:sugar phosphate nucleotidyltransferase [Flexistipes sinusarabici]|uniref:sugar phosphate nucleotidyltransferase n=1 Tax=Flexistipes sinusarabici TaxID=2352 RepID=UPI00235301A2|nr:sugar phosphate nucleotidyltransferase [Flexistipes sinusarabici]